MTKSSESLVTKRGSAHVKVAVVCVLCLVGCCANNWHPDNVPYRGGKAEGGHGGDGLSSGPEVEDAKTRHSEKKGKGHAKHQECHLNAFSYQILHRCQFCTQKFKYAKLDRVEDIGRAGKPLKQLPAWE